MTKYGDTAVLATKSVSDAIPNSPVNGWKAAAAEIFPDQPQSQKKSCPRGAYLGLCEEGLIKEVVRGSYTRSKKNKTYALRAHALLCADPSLYQDSNSLWQAVIDGEKRVHNGQMDVVLALWKMDLLRRI